MASVPELRVRRLNQRRPNGEADYVLYWMIANRRPRWNFSFDRAVEWCRELKKPLLIFEPLQCDYAWASDRLHRFVLQGMASNRKTLADGQATYYPYVEPKPGAGKGLLAALTKKACVVVTDDFPCFFLPRMISAASKSVPVTFEAVDSNGLLPMRAAEKDYPTAYAFRRFLQKELPRHLGTMPLQKPLAGKSLPQLDGVPKSIARKWTPATDDLLEASRDVLCDFPIDHDVGPAMMDGGSVAADARLAKFLEKQLPRYEDRNHPDEDAASGLSPYLHFGHVSTHEVFSRLAEREQWTPEDVSDKAAGKRSGWWGMSPPAEAFLDELVTWRELGLNMCTQREDYDQYDSLPDWARTTLEEHADDPRKRVYSLEALEHAETDDHVWNAAQRQLVREGRLHNYLRMLWGKKILGWTKTPQDALAVMIELNNKYAVDGRDPNSYSGIFWVLGRYDRAWGPERLVFGKIRYMTSDSTVRKLRMKAYLDKYGPEATALPG